MKMTLMTPKAIKEIESLIPDHGEALMQWGAQMYRDGIVKGAIVAGIGTMIGMLAIVWKECYSENREKKSNSKGES